LTWVERDIDCDYDVILENVRSCKRHTVVHRAFCFWRFTLLFLGLVTHYRGFWFLPVKNNEVTMFYDFTAWYFFRAFFCYNDRKFLRVVTSIKTAIKKCFESLFHRDLHWILWAKIRHMDWLYKLPALNAAVDIKTCWKIRLLNIKRSMSYFSQLTVPTVHS